MTFHRTLRTSIALVVLAGLAAFPAVGNATPLSPFIDLQEKGLTVVADGEGLTGWGGGPRDLTVDVQGAVRFALLYWAGRERPCAEISPGNCAPVAEPFKDQQMVFNGTPLTGTIVGTETQPITGGGPILNIGYFADVTSIVSAAGPGLHNFTLSDGNAASNLWRIDGATLIVGYTNASDPNTYRFILWDGLDSAFGPDPTPGDTRVTAPASLNHGANLSARQAQLWLALGDGTPDRPDNVTISNNATIFNGLDGSSGPQWDTDELLIDIPAGVGVTTVQANSEPNNQNPDSLLWQVVAIRVQQLDTARATCPTQLVPGPPAQAITTVRDTGSGLAEIVVLLSENADTVVPPFTVGTTDPLVITATKIDQSKRARIEVRVTDLAGNVAICDPIHTRVLRDSKPRALTFTDVPQAEDKITIMNGKPGLRILEVTVNGRKFRAAGLKDGARVTIDVSSAMVPGDNTVTLRGRGTPGSWADVFIWDGISKSPGRQARILK